jgi:hypothetical protein
MRSLSDIKRDLDLAFDATEGKYRRTGEYGLKLDQLHEMVKRLKKAFDELVTCMESTGNLRS